MSWINRIFRKQVIGQPMLAMSQVGQPISSPRNYKGFSEEGYQKNVVAFRAIKGIADAIKGVPWTLYSTKRQGDLAEIGSHEILDLLNRPNPMQGQAQFFEALTAFFLISGNTFVLGVGDRPGVKPRELWILPPDKMKVIPGKMGLPQAYQYGDNENKVVYAVDQVNLLSQVLHVKTFNPLNAWFGMSPIEAASYAIDQHNEAGKWNLALLQNKATPSGVVKVAATDTNPDGRLADDQFNRIRQELDHHYSGAANAGRPLLLEGGLDWTSTGFSPQDMDWLEGRNVSAKEIALAFGFPPVLLGIKGDSTYNNIKEAKLALYEDTVIPLMNHFRDALNNWLVRPYGDNLYLDFDKDDIDVIAEKRAVIWDRVKSSDFLTINEKREAVGYEPIDGGDEVLVQTSLIPLQMAVDTSALAPQAVQNSGDYRQSNEDEETDPEENLEEEDAEEDEESFGKALSLAEFKAAETRFDDFIGRWIIKHVGENITRIYGTTRQRVMNSIRKAATEHIEQGTSLSELSSAIQNSVGQTYDTFGDSRARLIARTETAIASGEGSREAAKSLQLPGLKKEWVAAEDDRDRGIRANDSTNHMEMDGVQVDMDEKFSVWSDDGYDDMDGPGDPHAPADQLCNCRCVLTYSRGEKSFNLGSPAAKRRFWLKTLKQRKRHESRLFAQLTAAFKTEKQSVLDALQGIHDPKLAEHAADAAISVSQPRMEKILKTNLEIILREFGEEILKIGRSS